MICVYTSKKFPNFHWKNHQEDPISKIDTLNTIQQSHPLLMKPSLQNQTGFNLLLWSAKQKNLHLPIENGNMGDIFSSHLGYFFANQLDLGYFSRCTSDRRPESEWPYKLTIALVGSIAEGWSDDCCGISWWIM